MVGHEESLLLAEQLRAMTIQRDELLKALRAILPLALIGAARRRTQLADEADVADVMQIDRELDAARAAIARAEGSKATRGPYLLEAADAARAVIARAEKGGAR